MAGKRRANGEGSIFQRKDGRWVGVYVVVDANHTCTRKYVYAKTKAKCAEKLREALIEKERNQTTINSQDTVGSFYKAWRDIIAPNYLEPTTIEQYEWVFNDYILPLLGNKPLKRLSIMDVQKLINTVYSKTKSARTCKEVRYCLSGVLKRAISQQLINYNPVAGVEAPSYKPEEKQPWSIEELKTFLSATTHCRYFPIFKLASYYGMRKGEVLGLRAKDIELYREPLGDCYGLIHIRQQVSLIKNIPTIREKLKTKSSRRDLPITEEMKSFLLPLLENKGEEELLFHTASNNPINPNNLLRAYKREIKRLGLRYITMHCLRHTACTLLRDAGVDPKTAQVIMGHADISTTLKVYTHSNMDKKVEAMDKLSVLYSNSAPASLS